MRRTNGSSPFNLTATVSEDRQKTHKRKRSNDDSHDDDNKRTKVDKCPANNNVSTASKTSSVEKTLVDLAAEKSGNPEETNSAQNSPATVKPLLTLPALSEVSVHLDTDLHKIEQEYKQALERAKETQKNERIRLCEQMERELKEKEQEYKDLLKKWDMQVTCGICYDQFLRSQMSELKHLPCHPKSYYCLSCYCKMFKVSAYGHSYRLWVECPLCRAKWWTDVQTFNDHNGLREGSSVQSLPGPLSPFTARDVPPSIMSAAGEFFANYRRSVPLRPSINRFVVDEEEDQDDDNTGDSESDLLHTFAQNLHETLNDRSSSNNATNAANDNHTVINTTVMPGVGHGHVGPNTAQSGPRAIRSNDYRIVDFFPWDQPSSSAASPYVISDLDDSDEEEDDDLEIGYQSVYS